jgi:hypothetical protein
MKALMAWATMLAAWAAFAGLAVPTPASATPQPRPSDIEVMLGQNHTSAAVGDRVTIRARIVNAGSEPTGGLIAHVNVTTLDSSVYVDLEDWTASPTQELAPVPPGGETSAAWEIQAVNVGRFGVYVVVLPNSTLPSANAPLIVSPAQLVEVAGRRTLSPGGVLPLVVVVPLLLGVLAVAVRLRTRRSAEAGADVGGAG